MSICIYCLKSKVEFSKEHVIPQSFGTFGTHTFTLINRVCADCNDLFGKTLDIFLARDSVEGIKRIELLKLKKLGHPGRSPRLKISFPSNHPDPDLQGVVINTFAYKNSSFIEPLPQIHLKLKNSMEYKVYTLDEFKVIKKINHQEYVYKDIKMIAPDKQSLDELVKEAENKGIKYIEKVVFFTPDKPKFIELKGIIDTEILRAIAKIAFNYFTFIFTDIDVTVSEFNKLRDFILSRSSSNNIQLEEFFLGNEDKNIGALTDGILIGNEERNGVIVIKIRIFDYHTYVVPIAKLEKKVKPVGYFLKPGTEPVKLTAIDLSKSSLSIVTLGYDWRYGGFVWKEKKGRR